MSLLVLIAALPSLATTWTVMDTSDSALDTNTLRYAINHAGDGDTINFGATGTGTIILDCVHNGALVISQNNLTISGPGAASLLISGGNACGVFVVNYPGVATIYGVTIEKGSNGNGGAISNASGTVTLSNCFLSGNKSTDGGGAIYNGGTMTISNCTFWNNTASVTGGAIANFVKVTVSNSTFVTNSSPLGGGIFNSSFGDAYISNSTFSGNSASSHGGGIYTGGGETEVKNTLMANEPTGGNCYSLGDFISEGYNLSDDDSCTTTAFVLASDLNNTPAGLDPNGLQYNGGSTQTIALLAGSPGSTAIDAIPLSACTDAFGNLVTTDQRGVTRPQGATGYCDIGAYELTQVPTANVCPNGQTSPAPCSYPITLQYYIPLGTTLGTNPVQVVTQGATGLDFKQASTGNSCIASLAGPAYCIVDVTFAPITPGLRLGAATLIDNNGNPVASYPISGIGNGPAIAFGPGVQSTVGLGNYTLQHPWDVAVDAAGDIFVSDFTANRVVKVPPGGGQATVLTSEVSNPAEVAVDGAGNVFVADEINGRLVELPYLGNGTYAPQTTVISGLNAPQGVAVDGAGDLFVSSTHSGIVLEIPAGGGAPTPVGSGLSRPSGLAVDGAGNVFIADYALNQVLEVTPGGGQSPVNTGGYTLSFPYSVAVDGAGNVFIADYDNERVLEVPAGGGAPTVVAGGLSFPIGVAVDAAGNIFIANTYASNVLELNRSQAPTLTFASTTAGTTSIDSPKSVTVQNVGNQPLNAVGPGLAVTGPNFVQVFGTTTLADCISNFPLAVGGVCDLSISFTPMSDGLLKSTAIFTDNTLNANPSTTQTINLQGTGTGCSVDSDCSPGNWCYETAKTCTAPLANNTSIPSDSGHNPTLNGVCTAPAGALVCASGVCDTNNKCGYTNGDGPCVPSSNSAVCDSGVCGPDTKCGYASGNGPCTALNASTVCRSGACSVSGVCEAPGSCYVDGDCSNSNWCDESVHTCDPKLANNSPIPSDPPHTSPTLNGTCSAPAAALVCLSGVCDTDNKCGYANGDGACTPSTSTGACRSGTCGADGRCEPVAGPAFTCSLSTYLLSQGSPTTLYNEQFGAGGVTSVTIGGAANLVYNALAFNPNDNYLYASSRNLSGPPQLLKIDSGGGVSVWENFPSLPSDNGNQGFFAATFDASGNYIATTPSGASPYLYELNIASNAVTVVPMTLNGAPFSTAFLDFTYSYGYLWGIDPTNSDMARIDPTTGIVTEISQTLLPSGSYGAAWTFGNGNLGFGNNATGVLYQIAVANPTGATPTLSLVSSAAGQPTSNNDGAACVSAPADMSVVVAGPATVAPSGAISWTLTVTNNGAGGSSGFSVSDSVPAGITNVATTTLGCSVSGSNVICSEGPLAANATPLVITITGTAQSTDGTCITNTATVVGNESDPNSNNNSSSVQTCTNVTVTPSVNGGNGTISPNTAETVAYDATPSFTLTPSTGYHIGTVGGTCPSGTLVGNTYTTGAVTSDCTVIANFAINTYVVTPSVNGGNGTISPNTGQTVNYGGTQAFTLTPSTGYHIGSVTGTCPSGTVNGNTYTTGAVTSDCTVIANFAINTYLVTPTVSNSYGTISPNTVQTANYGATSIFTVAANVGYSITGVGGTCGGSLAANLYTTNAVTANCTVVLNIGQPPTITSVNHATFQTGLPGSFPVTATGIPAVSSFTETGKLPSGVTLNMSSGLLGGTPAAGTGGTYPITITASNGVSPNATQSFTLTVNQPPQVTGTNYATFTKGTVNSFTVTTTGFPAPALSFSPAGTLPAGVTFVDNHNGTATLSGKPTVSGLFTFWITAANGVSPSGLESFTLTVH